jgi:hypothetical protein
VNCVKYKKGGWKNQGLYLVVNMEAGINKGRREEIYEIEKRGGRFFARRVGNPKLISKSPPLLER